LGKNLNDEKSGHGCEYNVGLTSTGLHSHRRGYKMKWVVLTASEICKRFASKFPEFYNNPLKINVP
jgi:hypothetical protein